MVRPHVLLTAASFIMVSCVAWSQDGHTVGKVSASDTDYCTATGRKILGELQQPKVDELCHEPRAASAIDAILGHPLDSDSVKTTPWGFAWNLGDNDYPPKHKYFGDSGAQCWLVESDQNKTVWGEPYDWGGWDSVNEFISNHKAGVSAGHHDTEPHEASKSTGTDCSGLVSRAWGLPTKTSTKDMFPAADDVFYDDKVTTDKNGETVHQSIVTAHWFKKVKRGDALVFRENTVHGIEGHTVLVDHVLEDGQVCIVAASGHAKTFWKYSERRSTAASQLVEQTVERRSIGAEYLEDHHWKLLRFPFTIADGAQDASDQCYLDEWKQAEKMHGHLSKRRPQGRSLSRPSTLYPPDKCKEEPVTSRAKR